MTEIPKCFCDLYKDCVTNPDRQISVGHNAVEDREEFITGAEFTKRADEICPGTRVYIAQTALNAETVKVEADTASITVPREAVTLQCEYFVTAYPGM